MTLAADYSASAQAWKAGPARIYDELAAAVVACSPIPVSGRRVLDIGAGTGAASRAALAAGAERVAAVDIAHGMLAIDALHRPPGAVGDIVALPVRDGAADIAVAAFALNHLRVADLGRALAEMARVICRAGVIVASAFSAEDAHPVKAAVEAALAAEGWRRPEWEENMRSQAVSLLSTRAGAESGLRSSGLSGEVLELVVEIPELAPEDLVSWRLGMAQHAPYVAGLDPHRRAAVTAGALARLGDAAPLVRRVIVVVSEPHRGVERSTSAKVRST